MILLLPLLFWWGIALAASLITYLRCREGDFLVDALRASQYILGCDISLIVFILYHWAKRGFLKMAFSFDSMRFVETLCPCAVFIF